MATSYPDRTNARGIWSLAEITKNKLEDGYPPDKVSSDMDLFNNKVGALIGVENSNLTQKELVNLIIYKIKKGKMKIIKKDDIGNFLTCKGVIISAEYLKGKWENKKCLVASNKK